MSKMKLEQGIFYRNFGVYCDELGRFFFLI